MEGKEVKVNQVVTLVGSNGPPMTVIMLHQPPPEETIDNMLYANISMTLAHEIIDLWPSSDNNLNTNRVKCQWFNDASELCSATFWVDNLEAV